VAIREPVAEVPVTAGEAGPRVETHEPRGHVDVARVAGREPERLVPLSVTALPQLLTYPASSG
jgi:hypothetical protein